MSPTNIQINYILREQCINLFFIFIPAFLISFQLFILVFALTSELLPFCCRESSLLVQGLPLCFEQILEPKEELLNQGWESNVLPLLEELDQGLLVFLGHIAA